MEALSRSDRASRTVAIGSGAVLLAGCAFGGLNSLDMPGTEGHGNGLLHHHRRTARRGDAAAELAGDGRRRHRRQRVGHRGRAAARRHVLRGGQGVAGRRASTCPPTRRRRSRRPRCSARSTSTSPRRSDQPAAGQAARGLRTSRWTAPAAIRPPKRCCRRSASWSTRAISVRCKTSPTRRTPRSPAASGQFADLIPRLAELTTSLDQQTDDIVAAARRAEPLRRHPRHEQGQPRPHAGHRCPPR